jgi:hypothetical protein
MTFLKGPRGERDRELLISKLTAFSSYLGIMLRHYCESGEVLPLSAFFEEPGPQWLPQDVKALIQGLLSGS